MQIVTLSERKAAAVDRKRSALAQLRRVLAAHAHGRGGRYILYGSAARGALRYDSDIDLIVDFPPDLSGCACDVAETACSALDLPLDLRTADLCRRSFLDHVLPDAEIIG